MGRLTPPFYLSMKPNNSLNNPTTDNGSHRGVAAVGLLMRGARGEERRGEEFWQLGAGRYWRNGRKTLYLWKGKNDKQT